jgi:RimJ/RimL family protein N-acetyltransferase
MILQVSGIDLLPIVTRCQSLLTNSDFNIITWTYSHLKDTMEAPDLFTIPIEGRLVNLRDAVPDDLDHYGHWLQQGEWRKYDAPWEHADSLKKETEIKDEFERCFLSKPLLPRKRLIIATPDNCPIGWVNRYGDKRFPASCHVGIDICEDTRLNHGLGTEALRLWVGHQFAASDFHRVAFDTYSFNIRVIRLAEKLGFTLEGRDREIVRWQGEWIDRLHFSLLRMEWETRAASSA